MLISWNTTFACNLGCKHCYRDAGAKGNDELSTEQGKRLLDQIALAGFKIIILSGGEPLMRPDIYNLISYARNIGLRPVLGTNGTLLTEETAANLKQAGLFVAGISLDSLQPDLHDDFRQQKGAWEKTVDSMINCRKVGLSFQIHTTAMTWNESEILKITDFAVDIGARAHHIFFLVPTGRGKEIEDNTLKTVQYEKLLNDILDKQALVPIELKPTCAPQFMRIAKQKGMNTRFTKGCLAGTAYCVVLPNGDVHPCPYLPMKLGNVKETDFNVIWRDSEVLNRLRHEPLTGSCGTCGFADICGGCRARAYYYSDGDYLSEEPWCSFHD